MNLWTYTDIRKYFNPLICFHKLIPTNHPSRQCNINFSKGMVFTRPSFKTRFMLPSRYWYKVGLRNTSNTSWVCNSQERFCFSNIFKDISIYYIVKCMCIKTSFYSFYDAIKYYFCTFQFLSLWYVMSNFLWILYILLRDNTL